MAILHCYFDESGKKSDHPVVTFSGVCISESKLSQFDDAWKTILRFYGIQYLHMARASRLSEKVCELMPRKQTASERTAALLPFADCINDHFEYGLIQAMDVKGFHALLEKNKKHMGDTDDPYYIAFARGLCELIEYVHDDDYISVICDDDKETAWGCYSHYRAVRNAYPEVRDKIVALTFADDKAFPALQAADMVAFLSRLESKARFYGDRYDFRNLFLKLTTERGVGHTKWGAVFADKSAMESVSDGFFRIFNK